MITVFLRSIAFCFFNIPGSFRLCGLVLALCSAWNVLLWMWHKMFKKPSLTV